MTGSTWSDGSIARIFYYLFMNDKLFTENDAGSFSHPQTPRLWLHMDHDTTEQPLKHITPQRAELPSAQWDKHSEAVPLFSSQSLSCCCCSTLRMLLSTSNHRVNSVAKTRLMRQEEKYRNTVENNTRVPLVCCHAWGMRMKQDPDEQDLSWVRLPLSSTVTTTGCFR